MSKGPTVSQRLAHIKHMPTLVASTMAIEKPVEGYLLKDIIKMSYENVQARVFLQDYLCNLLASSKNVLVKFRVLQILIAVLEEGHEEFRTNLRRQSDPVKETSRLRSANTRVQADCGRIRDIANKVLDILFNEDWVRPAPQYVLQPPKAAETSGEVFPERNKPPTATPSQTLVGGFKTMAEKLKIYPKQVIIGYDESYVADQSVPYNVQPVPSPAQSYPSYPSASAPQQYGTRHSDLPQTNEHVRGRAGGGWEDKVTAPVAARQQTVVSQPVPPPPQQTTPTPEPSAVEETRLVDDITAVGGVRVAPSKEQLQLFLSRCKCLDVLTIVDLLRVKLTTNNHSVTLRTLCVFEALLRSDVPEVVQTADLALGELVQLQSSSHHAVKAKATKIVCCLGQESPGSLDQSPATQQQQLPGSSLLDLTADPAPHRLPPSGPPPATTANELDIFGSPNPDPRQAGVPNQPAGPPLAQQPTTNGDMSSIFSNMQLATNQQPAAMAPPPANEQGLAPMVPPPEQDSLMDFEAEDELDPLAPPRRTQSNASGFLTSSGNFNFGRVGQNSAPAPPPPQDPLIRAPAGHYPTNMSTVAGPHTQTGMAYPITSGSGMPIYSQNSMGQTPAYFGVSPLATPPQTAYAPSYGMPPAGQSRPVQRPPPKTEDTSSGGGSFGFIDKSSKDSSLSPFGFIGDEMLKASQKK